MLVVACLLTEHRMQPVLLRQAAQPATRID